MNYIIKIKNVEIIEKKYYNKKNVNNINYKFKIYK